MNIRNYKKEDNNEIYNLFYNTVHSVNLKDYNEDQINVWAKENVNLDNWCEKFTNSYTVIAEEDGCIIGFSNIDDTGYIDMLYVHKDCQHKGVASALLKEVENYSVTKKIHQLLTYSSKTARDFFSAKGYEVSENNIVIRDNIELENYLMKKEITLG